MCEQCEQRELKEARFWRTVRRALIMIVNAIADRYPEGGKNKRAA